MRNRNKNVQTYISNVKALLPVYSKDEREFIRQLRSSLDDYVTENPDVTIENIIAEFGEPLEVVHSYIDSMDTDTLIHKISIRKILRWIMIMILAAAIIGVSIFGYTYYKAYQYYKKTVVTEVETVIE